MLDLVKEVPFFDTTEAKQNFLIVVGALNMRLISLKKASEIMNIQEKVLLEIMSSLGIEYSYLSKDDIETEREWK